MLTDVGTFSIHFHPIGSEILQHSRLAFSSRLKGDVAASQSVIKTDESQSDLALNGEEKKAGLKSYI